MTQVKNFKSSCFSKKSFESSFCVYYWSKLGIRKSGDMEV